MKRIKRILKKFSFTNIFFFIMSLISTTFAWFAYSNVIKGDLSVDVKAWNISITDDNNIISNDIEINVESFFPGCEKTSNQVEIVNNGDLSAILYYNITEVRIFDEIIDLNEVNIIDSLSQDYPFTFNFSLNSNVIEPGETALFSYTIEWPMDSGDNLLDGSWGNLASSFNKNQGENHLPGISLIVELVVEQNIQENINTLDYGKTYKLDTLSHNNCDTLGGTCNKYYKLLTTDEKTYYLGDTTNNYESDTALNINNYINTNTSIPTLNDILNVIGKDIYDTKIIINNYSNRTLGNSSLESYTNRINKIKEMNGKISFSKWEYNYLASDTCYWLNTEYDTNHNFAIKNNGDNIEIYPELKTNNCKMIPIINKNTNS